MADNSEAKVERLFDLIALLLETRQPLTMEQITERVVGYQGQSDAVRRMFERDKDELRALGIPLELVATDPFGPSDGYRIPRQEYRMPPLSFSPAEQAALSLAARAWTGTRGDTTSAAALAALGLEPESATTGPLTADLGGESSTVLVLMEAVMTRRRVRFAYRTSRGDVGQRELDAYGLVSRRGTWYVVGYDLARCDLRAFRLSRFACEPRFVGAGGSYEIPAGLDLDTLVGSASKEASCQATVAVPPALGRLLLARGAHLLSPLSPGATDSAANGSGATGSGTTDGGGASSGVTHGGVTGSGGTDGGVAGSPHSARPSAARSALEARGAGDQMLRVVLRPQSCEAAADWVLANQVEAVRPAPLRARVSARLEELLRRLSSPAPALPAAATPDRATPARAAAARSRVAAGSAGSTTTSTSARLRRLLVLVPWIMEHDGPTVAEVCRQFALSEQQLSEDLQLLAFAGLPPYTADKLIDAEIAGGRIRVRFAEYLSAPRLSWREASGLYVAARSLAASLQDSAAAAALWSAARKLEETLPPDQRAALVGLAHQVKVQLDGDDAESSVRGILLEAIEGDVGVQLEYYHQERRERTVRVVDPWTVFLDSGHWYLQGWCHEAHGPRFFRLDRIVSARIRTEPRVVHPDMSLLQQAALPAPQPGPQSVEFTLLLDAATAWITEYVPVLDVRPLVDGRVLVRLMARTLPWAVALTLRLAPDATPVEPASVRDAVAAAARELVARHQGEPVAHHGPSP